MSLKKVPEELIVIGAGVIGVELVSLAYIFKLYLSDSHLFFFRVYFSSSYNMPNSHIINVTEGLQCLETFCCSSMGKQQY